MPSSSAIRSIDNSAYDGSPPITRVTLPACCAQLVSYQIDRQLSGRNPPPLVTRAFGAHQTEAEYCGRRSMTSFRQIDANRRNALKSTGPNTEAGKERLRCNAVRHGLTAETVIGALEDAEDYKAFEAAIIADYDAQSAVERELVLRLASLLWRLRRATTIETGLFEIQAGHLREFRHGRQVRPASREFFYAMFGRADSFGRFRPSIGGHGEHNGSPASPGPVRGAVAPGGGARTLLFASRQSAQLRLRPAEQV